jgi:anti-anti-sigma regulatory factor
LWSTLEFALQEALGRAVVVNLVDVTGFDILAVEALIAVARTAKRQHVDMCAVVEPASVMRDHMASNSLGRLIPIYDSTEAASVAADTVVADEPEATLLVKSYLWAFRRAASSGRLRCEPLHLVDAT